MQAAVAVVFTRPEHRVLVVLAVAVLVEQQTEIMVRLELLIPEAAAVVHQVAVQRNVVAALVVQA